MALYSDSTLLVLNGTLLKDVMPFWFSTDYVFLCFSLFCVSKASQFSNYTVSGEQEINRLGKSKANKWDRI